MEYIIIGLIILFWLDYRSFKKKSVQVLEDLEKRLKEIEFPKEYRALRELWGAPKETIDKELEKKKKKKI